MADQPEENILLTPKASHAPLEEENGDATPPRRLRENLSGFVVQTNTPPRDIRINHAENGNSLSPIDDLKDHIDKALVELKDQSRRDFEKVLWVLQQESAKRTALEGRLHSQLLMQSETMVAMELKLLRLEAKVERREMKQQTNSGRGRPSFSTIDEEHNEPSSPPRNSEVTNIAVISSGASLTSAVTATSLLDEGDDDGSEAADGDVEDEGGIHRDGSNDGSESTPTLGSRPQFGGGSTLESILMNPKFGEHSIHGDTTRAIRGDGDGNSSLATSVTNSTLTSTVVTATTRGDSVNRSRHLPEAELYEGSRGRSTGDLYSTPYSDTRQPRSRSNSPLTVQSSTMASEAEPPSGAEASAVASILSNVAVAPSRAFGTRRAAAAAAAMAQTDNRPRLVSFPADVLPPNNVLLYSEAGGDSITMPDELDNLSEVADTFAINARVWREEYEARLDALQKRWSAE